METNPTGNNLTDYLVPNSTQVPNVIFDYWLPLLKPAEVAVLLIIVRQTLGWVADGDTGKRKAEDWINNWQLQQRTGLGARSIHAAIQSLIEKALILVYSENGELLDTPTKRINASSKLFFRLNTLGLTQGHLFKRQPTKNAGLRQKAQNKRGNARPPQNLHPAKIAGLQNKPYLQKNTNTSNNNASVAGDKIKENTEPHYTIKGTKTANENEVKTGYPKQPKQPSPNTLPTRQLISAFTAYSVGIRGVKPVFVRYKDGNLIKHALRHLNANDLQMLFLWFLQNCTKMQPTLGAALCREVIAAYIKASRSQYGFYNDMDRLARQHAQPIQKPSEAEEINHARRMQLLAEMKAKLFDQNKNGTTNPVAAIQG